MAYRSDILAYNKKENLHDENSKYVNLAQEIKCGDCKRW